MKGISIILSKKLGQILKEKAEEMGNLPEDLAIELLGKDLNKQLDPEDLRTLPGIEQEIF